MPDDKKIIIDEDWKAQVQAEKEAAKQSGGEPERVRKKWPSPQRRRRASRSADAARFV